jgi:hypothetical protein
MRMAFRYPENASLTSPTPAETGCRTTLVMQNQGINLRWCYAQPA